jgi:hypothetical protein
MAAVQALPVSGRGLIGIAYKVQSRGFASDAAAAMTVGAEVGCITELSACGE